jgi:uncharacterized membrane protein
MPETAQLAFVLAQDSGIDLTSTLSISVSIIIGAVVGALIGNAKNRLVLGLVLGGLLGCIGWIIIALIPRKQPGY